MCSSATVSTTTASGRCSPGTGGGPGAAGAFRRHAIRNHRGARLRLATLDNGIAHLRTELAWLDAVEEEIA
ncbi:MULTISPECIES: hypothetical protein [Amycolatopsis]|uniref:hypothetical protein n=1 Tax=Amycolatopsis TaxID=1813 RepID=UPI000E2840A3|nr:MULTISPECIES: hypothetical protein [Amycolatopsis]